MQYSKKDDGLWRDTHSIFNDRDELIGEMKVQAMPTGAVFVVDGTTWLCRRRSLLSSRYLLKNGDQMIAEAVRPAFFKDRLLITRGDLTFEFARESGRGFYTPLWWGDEEIGVISSSKAKDREAEIDLPDSLPVHMRLYIYWLWTVLAGRYNYLG